MLSDPLHSIARVTTLTTVHITITINQILLRERKQNTLIKEISSFQTSSSTKGPARSTITLVLNGGDGTLGSPIDTGEGSGVEGLTVNCSGAETVFDALIINSVGGLHASDGLLEFVASEVSKLVEGEGVGVSWVGVVSLDFDEVLEEDVFSEFFFGGSAVGLVVLDLPA